MLRRYGLSLGRYFSAVRQDLEHASLGNLRHAWKGLRAAGFGLATAASCLFVAFVAFLALAVAVVTAPVTAPLLAHIAGRKLKE